MANDILAAALAARYTLLRELGGGGSATVYLATDLKHGREVAIKVLRPEFAASLAAERFLREIDTVARLQHPHIVPLLDSGEAAGFLYFVMPYVAGETLRERLRRTGRLPVGDVIRILADVADAVAHAHQRGVVHRDLKPENILLSGRHAVVTDFGVARAASLAADGARQLTVGVALGTPAYMAPEQAVASPDVDHRADLYALGVLGYELLAGAPPFVAPTPQDILAMHVAVRPEPLDSYRPDAPPELTRVLMRCLEKRPADRWADATELVSMLEPLATPSGGITPTGTPPLPARARRRRALLLAVSAVAVVLLILLLPRGPQGTPGAASQQQLTFLGNVLDAAPSPDGMFLAYTTEDSSGQRIVVRDLLGGNVVEVATAAAFQGIAWAPDGSAIRYATFQPERGTFVVPRLGGTARPMAERNGIPSPDGRQFAGVSSGGPGVVVRIPATGDSLVIPLPFDYLWPLRPSWSPDGDRLAIPLISATGQRSSIAVVPVSPRRPPQELVADSIPKVAAIWGPRGRTLYYLGLRGTVASLFRLAVDDEGRAEGPPVELLTGLEPGGAMFNGSARLASTADGRRLVYVRARASSNVGLLTVGGDPRTQFRQLTTGTAEHTSARLSPDGKRLAFFRTEPTGQVLQVVDLDGRAQAMEVAMLGEGFEVAWSPVDERVAISGTDRGVSHALRVFRPGSADQREYAMGHVGFSIDWGSAGSIVFQRTGNQRIGILDLASGRDTLLPSPDGSTYVFNPRMSPDGKWLAYRYSRGSELGFAAVAVGDTVTRTLGRGDIRPLRWSDDGRILYAAERPIGDNRERLLAITFATGATVVRQMYPAGFGVTDVTPDGRTVVLTRREQQSDAWLIELP